MSSSLYETITGQIVAAIEEGAGLYKMPWHRQRQDVTSPVNLVSSRAYRGLNIVTLWMTGEAKGYGSGTWATYQQWQQKGCQVRKGEKAAPVFFWKKLGGAEDATPQQDDAADRPFFVAKGYSVFNADQVDGYMPPAVPALSEAERITRAEAFFAAIPSTVSYGGSKACYIPSRDVVEMPKFGQFRRALDYYSVLAHELTHWSGAKERLARDLSGRFGSEAYAMEELVAELGAAFVAGSLQLPNVPREDHAPYIATWLKVLKNDTGAIFTTATKAQAAADLLDSYQIS